MSKSTGKAKSKTTSAAKEAVAAPTEAAQKVFEQATSFGGEIGEISRANMQAMTQSAQVASEGFKTLGKTAMSFMQETAERNMKVMQEMGSVKTVQDFTTLQSDFAKNSVKTYVEQMSEMAKMFATTMREAAEPLNAQAGMVAGKFQQSA